MLTLIVVLVFLALDNHLFHAVNELLAALLGELLVKEVTGPLLLLGNTVAVTAVGVELVPERAEATLGLGGGLLVVVLGSINFAPALVLDSFGASLVVGLRSNYESATIRDRRMTAYQFILPTSLLSTAFSLPAFLSSPFCS